MYDRSLVVFENGYGVKKSSVLAFGDTDNLVVVAKQYFAIVTYK